MTPWSLVCILLAVAVCAGMVRAENHPDLMTVPPDLENPVIASGDPAPGKMVFQSLPAYAGTEVAHTLYLPTDWEKDKRLPVIVEYYGNRRRVKDGGGLGYGLSGGKGFIWVVLPYVSEDHKKDMDWWWGDVKATVAYVKEVVPAICKQWSGDPAAVILVGHSRGAIACNYIGLHDEEIAKLWRAMLPMSHYDDGHIRWGMTPAEQARAAERLRRLGSIPQYICGEHHLAQNHGDGKLMEMIKTRNLTTFEAARKQLGLVPMTETEGTRTFVTKNLPQDRCVFVDLPYGNHTPDYVLRDIPERKAMREWLQKVLHPAAP